MDSRFCSTNWIRKLKRLHKGGLYNQAIGIEPVRNLKSLNESVVKRASARFQSCFCTRLTLFEFETIVSRSSEASNFQSLLQFAKKKNPFQNNSRAHCQRDMPPQCCYLPKRLYRRAN